MMDGFGKSDLGKIREINEDAILIKNIEVGILPNLYAVADGMGGHLAGEVASSVAVESLFRYFNDIDRVRDESSYANMLADAVNYANSKIYGMSSADENLRGMGTTMLAVTVKNNTAYIANVGDSRLYVISPSIKRIKQITIDHSYVMELLLKGSITKEEAEKHPNRNMITRALGTGEAVKVDRFAYSIKEDDLLLLCTDGLNSMLSDDEIRDICIKYNDKSRVVDCLINSANEKGGMDNTTVILYGRGEGDI